MSYLYPIETALLSLFDRIDDGEVSAEDAADTIEALELEYEAAVDGAATRIKELDILEAGIKNTIKDLQGRLKSVQDAKKTYDRVTVFSMQRLGKKTIETPRHKISIRRNPPSVVIENEALFIDWATYNAPELLRKTETYKPNRDAIKDAIEHGEAVPDAHIEQGESLRIK